MLRVRIFRPSPVDLEYHKTLFVDDHDAYRAKLVEDGEVQVGDVVYAEDLFYRLAALTPARWEHLVFSEKDAKALYSQAVRAECRVGEAWARP